MKLSRLFSGAVVSFLIFSASAQAASISVSEKMNLGKISAGEVSPLASYSTGEDASGTFNYLFAGQLDPKTKLSLTFSGNNVANINMLGGAQLRDNPGLALGHLKEAEGLAVGHSKSKDEVLPYINLSNVGTAQSPIYNLVIENVSDKIKSFSAYFSALVDLKQNGGVTVSSAAASVPLPAGVYLLGSGLLGLAGFAKRRKARA